jgi:hypothetical protein
MPGPAGMRPQIRNVVAVDLIAAKDAGIDFEGKSLVGLLDRAADREAEIKRFHSLRVESAAMNGRTFAGNWLERPFGIVRPIARSPKPQAKPPIAM